MHLLLVFMMILPSFLCAGQLSCAVSAESAVLINADTGACLFEKNASRPHFPASITKVATALYTLKQKSENLDELVVAQQDAVASISSAVKKKHQYKDPSHWLETGSTHIGIKRDEALSLKHLLFAVLVSSANDASNVVAQHVGEGSIETFVKNVNSYLQELGCKETCFLNPHGLHHPDHKTSARDMALIAREAMKYPLFREIVSTKNYVLPETNKQPSRTLVQTNKLLKKGAYNYSKAIGLKTGYTSDAGHTLIAAAKDDERTLIAVVLNCNERKDVYHDVQALFNAAFNEKKLSKKVLPKGPQAYKLSIEGASRDLQTYLAEDAVVSYFPSEEEMVTANVQWNQGLELPIAAHAQVGVVQLSAGTNRLVGVVPLLAYNDVKPSLYFSVKQMLKELAARPSVARGSLLVGMACVFIGIVLWMKRRKLASI